MTKSLDKFISVMDSGIFGKYEKIEIDTNCYMFVTASYSLNMASPVSLAKNLGLEVIDAVYNKSFIVKDNSKLAFETVTEKQNLVIKKILNNEVEIYDSKGNLYAKILLDKNIFSIQKGITYWVFTEYSGITISYCKSFLKLNNIIPERDFFSNELFEYTFVKFDDLDNTIEIIFYKTDENYNKIYAIACFLGFEIIEDNEIYINLQLRY